MLCIVYTCKIGSQSEWRDFRCCILRYNRLVICVLRRGMVFMDLLNPFDRYDDWDGDSGLVNVRSIDLSPRDSGNPLRHSWSSLLLFNAPLTSLVPRKGGYPQIASIRRIDGRPDLSDVGWTSHYAFHTIRCGPSDRPVSPIYPYLHISSISHTLLLQSYINVSTKSSLTTKISHIYHFPRANTNIPQH